MRALQAVEEVASLLIFEVMLERKLHFSNYTSRMPVPALHRLQHLLNSQLQGEFRFRSQFFEDYPKNHRTRICIVIRVESLENTLRRIGFFSAYDFWLHIS